MERVLKLAGAGGTIGLLIGVVGVTATGESEATMIVIACTLTGIACGLGLALGIRLLRIGHKALTKLERKLDD